MIASYIYITGYLTPREERTNVSYRIFVRVLLIWCVWNAMVVAVAVSSRKKNKKKEKGKRFLEEKEKRVSFPKKMAEEEMINLK